MDLKSYFLGLKQEEREPFSKKCGTSAGHMQNCAYGSRIPSAELAVAIETHSKGAVTRQEMFPATFKKTWPELRAVA